MPARCLPYTTDLTDEEWQILAPVVRKNEQVGKSYGGRRGRGWDQVGEHHGGSANDHDTSQPGQMLVAERDQGTSGLPGHGPLFLYVTHQHVHFCGPQGLAGVGRLALCAMPDGPHAALVAQNLFLPKHLARYQECASQEGSRSGHGMV
jgi:hypothetical protein